jgi:Fe2+ or Zn2+ uptake regulation protein
MIFRRLLDELSSNKIKITPQRKDILKILVRAKIHLSAREIYERMHPKYSNMSFDTVYRTLALLNQLGIVNTLDFKDGCSRYELNRHRDHHHHLVCLKCGGAWNLLGCPLEYVSMPNVPGDFKVTTHRFEVFGYCGECQRSV